MPSRSRSWRWARLALLLGWLGIDDALYPGQQIPYVLSGGIGGLFAVGLGAVLWLSADLRDEWRKLDDIDQKLGRLLEAQASQDAAAASVDGESAPRRRGRPSQPRPVDEDGARPRRRRATR